MAALTTEALTTEALEAGPDTRLLARRLIAEGRKFGRPVPAALDLATAITRISVHDTIAGSSSLTLSLSDPNLVLLTSGFLDANADGRLDAIDLNYPDRSENWWRLSTVSVTARDSLDLVFMERPAVQLMGLRGPLKASRASVTRAEFIKMLVAKHDLGVTFHSHDLHVTQKVEVPALSAAQKKAKAKDKGIADGYRPKLAYYTGAPHQLSKEEVANAETVLAAAQAVTTDERATLALLCACIIEAPFFANPIGGDASSSGILQLLSNHLGGSTSTSGGRRDITLVATQFLQDGFSGKGGAIQLAKDNPTMTPGEIAQKVQGSAFPDRYQKVIDSARTVLVAFGGAATGATGATPGKTKKQYNFQVGSTDNPKETYWDAMQRLASEVGWALFLDGDDIYFDPETTLIQQKPVALIKRMDEAVIDWSYDWDQRMIATEMTLVIVCEPFAFRAGQVVLLDGFGPASTGSTARPPLPGRWLISELERDRASWVSTLTLKQPAFPGREPAGTAVDEPADTGAGDGTTTGKVYAKASAIGQQNRSYVYGGGHGSWAAAEDAPGLDCSSSTSLALHAAGLMDGSSGPQVSGWFATKWGEAGKGKTMTVWASDTHVWIEFYGRPMNRFDTSAHEPGPSGPHLRSTPRSTSSFTARRFPGDA